jgi:Family of unknown function (DUF6171)
MSWPAEPCAWCPRVALHLSLPCLAQTTGHYRLCELARDGDPGYLDLLKRAVPAGLPPQPPSWLRKAIHLGRAIVQHLEAGLPAANETTVQNRLAICQTCEHYDLERTSCRVCGCNMQIKVTWLEQQCPIGKW